MRNFPDLPPRPGQELRMRLLQEAVDAEQNANCAVAIDKQCNLPAIWGHIIPKSRLEVISRNRQVIVAEVPPTNDVRQIGRRTDRVTFRALSPKKATTDRFSCGTHDIETFRDIEQEEVDWRLDDGKTMRRLVLLAYKATLPTYVREDRNARIFERCVRAMDHDNQELAPETAVSLATWHRTQAKRTGVVKSILEQMIRNQDYDHMTHIVTQTGSVPLLAAWAFFLSRSVLVEQATGNWGPEGYTPQFIMAYPSSYGQTIIRSWITPGHPSLTILPLGLSDAPHRHQEAQVASIHLLQQSDVIAISPPVWENYGHTKQRIIREHFEMTVPHSGSQIQAVEKLPDPQLLNLFGTTGLVIS